MMAAIGGAVLGHGVYAIGGAVIYVTGWALLRWQPTYTNPLRK